MQSKIHAVSTILISKETYASETRLGMLLASSIKGTLDAYQQQVNGLKALGRLVEFRDDWLVHEIVNKLSFQNRKQWELSLVNDEPPTFEQLSAFLVKAQGSTSKFTKTYALSDQIRNTLYEPSLIMRLLMQPPSETKGLLCSAGTSFSTCLNSDANRPNLNHATGLIKIRDYAGRWLPERLLFESGRVSHQRFTGENCNGSFMASHSRNVPIGSPIHEAWKNIHFSRDGRDGPSNVHRYPKRSARNSYDSQNSIRLGTIWKD
ncbi:unnamed protein product [Ceratitis capitata]|uniref:(Mediterranean fruit fly) hypothetical protein n=1 Tax=Ceratitis capitata TaxID=7213 RepID=A0A811UTI9_CERCA|nr:unnamed protein product [Ceratitis capitata]